METARSNRGNALVLLIVSLMFALVVGFIVINYTMLFTSHKEAQTAIDAGALQAAKDLGRIVVTEEDGTYFGNVALVDDSPPASDINKRPVIGINTIMATVRLDALIAHELGNTSMVVMAAQDLRRAEHDAKLLKDEIIKAANGGIVKDKDGHDINLVASANVAYDANAVKAIKGARRKGNLRIKVGTGVSRTKTNTPVPNPITAAQVDGTTSQVINGDYVYAAGVPVETNVLGTKLTFRFIPAGGSVALVENNLYKPLSDSDFMPPSIVQAEADEEVGIGPMKVGALGGQDKTEAKVINVMATAEAGTAFTSKAFPSGLLQVSFPGVGAPPSGQGVDFSSIKSIMNNSQVTLNTGKYNDPNVDLDSNFGSVSPYTGWNHASLGNWFSATGGAVPTNGGASVIPNHFRGRSTDDPSVVLSFVVYDWLRSMYLRPNIKDAADVLASPLWNNGQQAALNNSIIAPAYAEIRPDRPVTFGIFDIPKTGIGDRRDLRQFNTDREGFRRQFPNVFGYIPADMTLPGNSLVVSMDNNGRTTTTNGQPAEILFDFYNAVKKSNINASHSLEAAKAVLVKKVVELDQNKARIDSLADGAQKTELLKQRKGMLRQVARALAVSKNAQYTMNVTIAMLNDRKAVTSFGLKKESGKKYEIVTGNFYPVFKAATEAEILSNNPIATGQDDSLPLRDWACPSVKPDKSFTLVQALGGTKISAVPASGLHFLAPAHALTAVPPQRNNIFAVYVNQDGHMVRNTPLTSLSGPNVLETQYMYQNTASWITKSPGSSISQVWNCIARDNGAVYTKSYFADRNSEGNNASLHGGSYPVLIGEWSLRCPAPTSGPIPITPSTPPPSTTNTEVPPPSGTPTTTPPSQPPAEPPIVGETPTTPPTPPTPPTTPPTTPEGPNFCPDSIGPTGQVIVKPDPENDGGGVAWGDVIARVDSAGNVVYYANVGGQLKEMHFLTDFESWKSAVTSFEHKFNKTPGAPGKDRSLEFTKMDESELREYFATYGQPSNTTGVAAGEYQKDGNVRSMDDEIVDLLFSTYRAGVYYVEVGGCAKLFHFST